MSKLFKNPVSSSLKWSYHHLILGWLWALRSMKYLESYVAHSRCSIKVSRPPSPAPPKCCISWEVLSPRGQQWQWMWSGGGSSGWLPCHIACCPLLLAVLPPQDHLGEPLSGPLKWRCPSQGLTSWTCHLEEMRTNQCLSSWGVYAQPSWPLEATEPLFHSTNVLSTN